MDNQQKRAYKKTIEELDERDIYRHSLAEEVQALLRKMGFADMYERKRLDILNRMATMDPGDGLALAKYQGFLDAYQEFCNDFGVFILGDKIPKETLNQLVEKDDE